MTNRLPDSTEGYMADRDGQVLMHTAPLLLLEEEPLLLLDDD